MGVLALSFSRIQSPVHDFPSHSSFLRSSFLRSTFAVQVVCSKQQLLIESESGGAVGQDHLESSKCHVLRGGGKVDVHFSGFRKLTGRAREQETCIIITHMICMRAA